MTEEYTNKILAFLGEDGLIIKGKANDFYNTLSLTKTDVATLYDVVASQNSPLRQRVDLDNFMLCTFFFQAYHFPKAVDSFFSYVTNDFKKKGNNVQLSRERLIFVFNIVEFAHKYHKYDKSGLNFLIGYLNKFSNMSKDLIDFILFKHYSAILLYEYKEYASSNGQCYEVIPYITDALENTGNDERTMNLIKYVQLNINLLMLMNEKEDPNHDLGECGRLASEIFTTISPSNTSVALKVGFSLFDVYLAKGEINNCLDIYKKMKFILNKELFKGGKIQDGYYIYLALLSRKAYAYAFLKNKSKTLKAIHQIEDDIKFLDSKDINGYIAKVSYEFLNAIYKYGTDRNSIKQDKLNYAIDKYKELFDRYEKNLGYKIFNMNEIFINTLVIRPSYSWGVEGNKYIDSIINDITNRKPFKGEIIPSFVFGVFNRISGLTQNILTDASTIKQKEYRKKVKDYSKWLISVAQAYHSKFPILRTDYVKTAIVKALFVYLSILINENNESSFLNELRLFENNEYGQIIITENNSSQNKLPCFAYISKLKGDIEFKKRNYQKALDYFLDAENVLEPEDNNAKGCNKFSIGICYAFLQNKRKSISYLNKALSLFQLLIQKEILGGHNDRASKYESKTKLIEIVLKNVSK